MSSAEAKAFFEAYADCFTRGDSAGVLAHWALPAFISGCGNRSGVFTEADDFVANTQKLCEFYSGQGVARADKTILGVQSPYEDVALVRTSDRLSGEDGKMIAKWEHFYMLRRHDVGWRIFLAVADGELAAWEARGTPLGSQKAAMP